MSSAGRPAVVELRIPSRPEFVSVARLTILGVASRTKFTYDQVEDIRLAVGEACTTAVERAQNAHREDAEITIRSEISDGKLTVEVYDQVGVLATSPGPAESLDEIDKESLGALLMELLVDEFKIEPLPTGGTVVRMVKYAE
ncbi:MAG: ATP-binding protein [Armatimonadetes bacterium]|nr:ATP-binding protein [Armatimonadota bacterium]